MLNLKFFGDSAKEMAKDLHINKVDEVVVNANIRFKHKSVEGRPYIEAEIDSEHWVVMEPKTPKPTAASREGT